MFKVDIHTDGACSGNPGVGGYAAIIACKGKEKVITGCSSKITTNNKMELMAVVKALEALKKPCDVTVYTDSQYVITTARHSREWLTCKERPNHELWLQYLTLTESGEHTVTFVKVAGHSGDEMNERCDKLAKQQCVVARHKLLERSK